VRIRTGLEGAAGGAVQARHVALLAAVLGLSVADTATVGAIAGPLERALSIGNTQIGLLVTASTVVAAVATLPLGALADRVDRVRLLTAAILTWSAVLLVCGAATSYPVLLGARLVLGVLVATAGPVVASLSGDLFPAAQRGRIYGLILTGELLGLGLGFVVGGEIAAAFSWRWAFWVLAAPGLLVAAAVRTGLAEPRRQARDRDRDRHRDRDRDRDLPEDDDAPAAGTPEPMTASLAAHHVRPHPGRVITDDPAQWSLWRAAGYLVTSRSVLALVVASGLGYAFLAGFRTFGVLYVQDRFGLGQASATLLVAVIGLGALLGVQLTGRLADQMSRAGNVAARPLLAAAAFGVAAVAVVPALLTPSAVLCLGLLALTAAALGGANPPLDAARLDLVHPRLWGRAEAVRTVLRQSLEAGAPLLVGYLSVHLGARTSTSSAVSGVGGTTGSGGSDTALGHTFLVLAITLPVAAALLLRTARRTYPRDVATALATPPTRQTQQTQQTQEEHHP
jgi:predicted MFS family arabinose efflux permease